MMLQFLCENADKQGFSVNLTSIFTFIGMAFSIVVSLVALVWLTCFVVRLLIKTFKMQVQNSYDIYVENSSAKAQSKKERNAVKRKAKDARKMELLNMKQESQDRIHKMKVDKLQAKLMDTENKAEEKYLVKKEKPDEKSEISKEIKRQTEYEKLEKEKVKEEKKKEQEEKSVEEKEEKQETLKEESTEDKKEKTTKEDIE